MKTAREAVEAMSGMERQALYSAVAERKELKP